MTCRDVTGFLADYLADDMPVDLRELFEAHLGRCENCRRFLSQYRRVVAEAASVPGDEPLPPIPEELAAAVRQSLIAASGD